MSWIKLEYPFLDISCASAFLDVAEIVCDIRSEINFLTMKLEMQISFLGKFFESV